MNTGLQPLCRLVMIVACCVIGAQTGANGQTLTEKINMTFSRTTALQVIEELDRQSNYSFTFAREQLSPIAIPSFKAEGITLGEVLGELQKKYGLQFTVVGSNIVVKPVEKKDRPGGISGKVVDFESGDPLVGATVTVDGQRFSSITDEKGQYRLVGMPAGDYTLLVSYVGYKMERVAQIKTSDNNTTSVDVKLQPSHENTKVMVGVVVSAIKSRR